MSSLFFKRRKKAEAGGKNAHRTEKSEKKGCFFTVYTVYLNQWGLKASPYRGDGRAGIPGG